MSQTVKNPQDLFSIALEWINANKLLVSIIFFYFLFSLFNLTLLPIFNDESIYLTWGWIQTHWPGHLYDSMGDAKQPLMFWVFGIFENFFEDPLFAGRFASVLFGSITLVGIYKISKKIFNKKVGLISALLFSITPVFVFYNRQALVESGLMCVGIWAFYTFLNFLEKPENKNSIIFGIILGLGFFIKSTFSIFILVSFISIIFIIFRKKRTDLLSPSIIAFASLISVDALLLINPVFWQTFSSNSRYSFTFIELIKLPISTWMNSFFGAWEIGFIFITPLVFILGIGGLILMIKNKTKSYKIFIFFFLASLIFELLLIKSQSIRYLVPFLPFLLISASYLLSLLWKDKIIGKFLVIITLLIPLISSTFLIFKPKQYIYDLAKISKYSETSYLSGQTSGVGINEAFDFIKNNTKNEFGMILLGLNAGNPEDAINAYSLKSDNLFTFRMNSTLFSGLETIDCITSEYPTFFVTRSNELLGMEKYFSLEKSFPSSDNYYVGIYTLKKNCQGNTGSISDVYKEVIRLQLELRPEAKKYIHSEL